MIKLNLVNRVMETSSNDHVVSNSDRSHDSCGECQEASSAAMLVRRILSKLIETNKMDVIYYFDRAQPQKPHEILVKEQLNRIKKNIQFAKNFQLSKNLIPSSKNLSTTTQTTESKTKEETGRTDIGAIDKVGDTDTELEKLIQSLDEMDILDLLLLMYHDIDHELTNQIIQQKLSRRLNQTNKDSGNDLPKLELGHSQSQLPITMNPLQLSSSNSPPSSPNMETINENEFKALETKPFSVNDDSHEDPTQDPGYVPSSDQSVNQYLGATTDWSNRPPTTTSKPHDTDFSRDSTTKSQDEDKSE